MVLCLSSQLSEIHGQLHTGAEVPEDQANETWPFHHAGRNRRDGKEHAGSSPRSALEEACRTAVRVTREPGGTKLGERIRKILLASTTTRLAPLAELALMYAARAQHLQEVIRPALARGEIVVSDRYNDASLAYQGYGRELGIETVRAFDRVVCARTQPDFTLVLDLAPRLSPERAQGRQSRRKSQQERFEMLGVNFHRKVRNAYLAIARKEPHRVKVVQARGPVAEVQAQIRKLVDDFLDRRGFPLSITSI